MAEIEWDSSLSIGVKLTDERHKMLIEFLYLFSGSIRVLGPEKAV